MSTFISDIDFWHWFVLGGALLILEIIVPSTLLLWPGIAALFMGVLAYIVPGLTDMGAVALWAVLSLVTVVFWVRYRKANPRPVDNNGLNQRGQQLIGQVYILTKPLENGRGEIKVGDTVWAVVGHESLLAGENVRVSGVDGAVLQVVKA
jgi:membrane protein implicated in regulation of membrane protease activity